MNKPTPEEIAAYLTTEKNYDDFTAMGFADRFYNYYESNGWKVGRNQMKSWKAAIRTWELNIKQQKYATNQGSITGSTKQGTSTARVDALKKW